MVVRLGGTSRLLKKSLATADEDGIVAVVEGEFDLDGAVVLKFGRSVAGDLVALVEAMPSEEDGALGVFELCGGMDDAEGELRPSVVADPEIGRLDEIEIVAIPYVGLERSAIFR